MKAFILVVGVATGLVGAWAASWQIGLLVGLALWFATVQLWPWTACGACGGSPRKRDFTGENWRHCPSCRGSGRQLRTFVMRTDRTS